MTSDETQPQDAGEAASPDTSTSSRRRRRSIILGAGGVAVLGIGAFVLYWFQPHKLFIDERVDEDIPVVEAADVGDPNPDADADADEDADDTADDADADPVPEVVDLAHGDLISLDHSTSGTVRVLELADGSRYVRLEDLATDNGPDLYVWLSTADAQETEGSFRDDYVNLGRLQGNLGNQNYEIPADVDHTRFTSVVIYCDRFSSPFGAADLEDL